MEIEYEELPLVIHSEEAIKPGAPAVWDELPSNMPVETWFGDRAATDKRVRASRPRGEDRHAFGRVTGVPIELRAAVANYDKASGRYTLYAGSGGAVRQKDELGQVLGIKPDDLRVLSYDVGGNFGARNRVYRRIRAGAVGGEEGRPAGEVHRDALGSVSHRLSGPRSRLQGGARARKDGKLPGHARDQHQQYRRARVSLSPLVKGAGLITGLL